MGALGNNIFGSGNHDSPLGNLGKRYQKYTDPIAMIPGVGDKWVNLTSVEIPRMSNTALSKVITPFDRVDETINPVRRYITPVDKIGDVVRDKPASAIGTAVGSFFGGGALLGGLGAGGAGGGAGSALGGAGGGALGGGEAGVLGGGLGAGGYGGGIGSSVLPGIFEGGSVGTGSFGGGSLFGGGLGTGSITGTSAPLFSNVGLLGSGGAGLFGGNGLSAADKGQLFQQAVNQFKPSQNQGTVQVGGYGSGNGSDDNNRPTATVSDNATNALIARLLMDRQYGY